jgi:hypothetical protein
MIAIQHYFSRQAVVAVAVFFGLLLTIIFGGVALIWTNHDLQSEFDSKSRVLASLGGQVPLNTNASRTLAPTLLAAIPAPTETVAASQLHQTILTALDEVGGSVHSIQAEATTDTIGDGFRRLNAQIDFDCSMGALQKLLFHLETAIPFIFIDSIVVQPTAASANGAMSGEMLLRVTLVTSSYWKELASHGGE